MSGIDKVIDNVERIELSGADVMRITDHKTNLMTYEELEKYDNIDSVLGEHEAVVLLYETKSFREGHYIALFKIGNNTLEFFDSYGLELDAELNIAPDFNKRQHNGELIPHLSVLISKSNYKVISNKTPFQRIAKDVNTCGRFVSLRIRLRELSLKTFTDYLTKNKYYDADFWVSALTILV